MSSADTIISALRTGHDSIAELVSKLSDDDLARPSGAAEWDISQVLSHLGSGAEITQATVQAALDRTANPGHDVNMTIWARWNAMSRRQRSDGFLQANRTLTGLYESMNAGTRENLRIDIGFMPVPVTLATAARLRLSELTLHSWDVRVVFDEQATLAPEATDPLVQGTADLISWISKPAQLNGKYALIQVETSRPTLVFALHLDTQISVDSHVQEKPDGTLAIPAEAWLRLVAGRLAPDHTPSDITTTGAADLDLLRKVFPGY